MDHFLDILKMKEIWGVLKVWSISSITFWTGENICLKRGGGEDLTPLLN